MKASIHVSLQDDYQITGNVRNGYTSNLGPQNRYATLDIISKDGSITLFTQMGKIEQFVAAMRQALNTIEHEVER